MLTVAPRPQRLSQSPGEQLAFGRCALPARGRRQVARAHQRAGAHAEQPQAPRQVDALQALPGGVADGLRVVHRVRGSVRSRVTVLKSSKRSLMPIVRPA